MSNALVDNIGNASGSLVTPTQYVVRGSAKVLTNFNGTGTVAVRKSLNTSSLVDNGTGNYAINFSNAFADGNHVSQQSGNANQHSTNSALPAGSDGLIAANSAGTLIDGTRMLYASFGDLA